MTATRAPVEERFWRHVTPTTDGSCWIWQGKPNSVGYGKMGGHHGRSGPMLYAHRVSYEIHKGPIPAGLQIDHLCRNRMCVNPDHLEAVTSAVNNQRAMPYRQPQESKPRTHCPRGHSMDDAILVNRRSRVQRLCRPCQRARVRCRSGHAYSLDPRLDSRGRRICETCVSDASVAS